MRIKSQLILVILFITFTQSSFSQTYIEQMKKCSEILDGVSVVDSGFWQKLELRNNCLIGLKAPSFKAKTINGLTIDTDSLRGKVLVLNFWFTKCSPCVKEIPTLNNLVKDYKEKDILFLSLANDGDKKLSDFLKTTAFNFQHIPSSRILIDTFKLFGIWPTTVIIDKQGFIQFIKVGVLDNSKDSHIDLLNRLLSQ